MTPTAHERALQAARALRERQPATLLLWRSLGNLSHGLLLPVVAILMWLALATFSPADPAWSHTSNASDVVYQNSLGIYGAWFSDVAYWLFGKLAYALPILILLCNAHYWASYKVRLVPVYVGFATLVVRWLGFVFGFCSVLLCGSLIAHAALPDTALKTAWQGIAGSGLSTAVLSLGPPAAFFVVLGLLSLSVTMLFERSYTWLLDLLGWPFVALFEKIAGSIAATEQAPSYARGDDFQFDFEHYEAAANGRQDPAFAVTEQVRELPTLSVAKEAVITPAAFSALDDDELDAAPPQPTAEMLRERIEPSLTDDFYEVDVPQVSAAALAPAALTSENDDDDFALKLAATQRIGAAELPPVLTEPSTYTDLADTDAPLLGAGFATERFDEQDVDNNDFDASEFDSSDVVENELTFEPVSGALNLREPTISFDDEDFESAYDSAAPQRKPIPALHAEADLAQAAQAAKNFTLDSRAIANLRLHYSDTQSLSPLMTTQTAQLSALDADDDDDFAATGAFDAIDESLQATVLSSPAPAAAVAAMAAMTAAPVVVQPALDLQPAVTALDELECQAAVSAESVDAESVVIESGAVETVAPEMAGPAAVVIDPAGVSSVRDEAIAAAVVEQTAAAQEWPSPIIAVAQQAASAQEFTPDETALNETQTLQVSLPPILDETLNGPLTAIPLLDQTLSLAHDAVPVAAEPLSETATSYLRCEVDEFSHVDYDDEAYSSPIKASSIARQSSAGTANHLFAAAADSLQALSQDLANTQLLEPFNTPAILAAETAAAPSTDSDTAEWEEGDSLSAALDALAKTAMFRHDSVKTAAASAPSSSTAAMVESASYAEPAINLSADSAPEITASEITASEITAPETTAVRASDAPVDAEVALPESSGGSLSAAIEQRLSQTAKLLAADVSASLRKFEASSGTFSSHDAQLSQLDNNRLAAQPVAETATAAVTDVATNPRGAQPESTASTSFAPQALTQPAAATNAAHTIKAEPVLSAELASASPDTAPNVSPALLPNAPLRTHPQAGPVIPVNPALAAAMSSAPMPSAAASFQSAQANTLQAPPSNINDSRQFADTINFSSAKPVDLQGSFSAPPLPVASADKHSLDIFASDPSIRRLSYNCATAVQVGDVGLPPLSLLRRIDESERKGFSEEKLISMSRLLEEKLADFGVEIKVANVLPGPVITRFEVLPAPGIKASRISGLSTDLARSLAVTSVRVLEVIPGTSCVGIEVPNAEREMVYLGDVLNSEEYQAAQDPLTLALGYDISGQPAIANLGKMPHVLVAGTTGSGKSVGVNTMLLSMLFKASPEDVRLILVDPKFLELSVYERIPHLLTPVITDMNIAANALRWAVGEMERRYQLMSKLGVRNLAGFNQKVVAAEQAGSPLEDPIWQVDPDDTSASKYVRPYLCKLPSIVIVIDEFADMMMMAGKKCEVLITRIAQKARAAGIHLVLATQRPSVDVITGLIKANIPTRIAFTVSTKIDSRTILDQSGAEELLGAGDMLFAPPNARTVMRVHGAFVSDDEVHAVISDWCSRAEPNYLHSILEEQSSVSVPGLVDETPVGADGNRPDDVLYDQVLDFILTTRKASISAVQRRFGIGYNRSAKIIESMEAAGVLGPAGTGAGNSRDILIGTDDD